jgi:hypothetical protein
MTYLTPPTRYTSYLLRLQWVQNDGQPIWIASMQCTKTGELCQFPNIETLVQFLREEYGECDGAVEPPNMVAEANTPAAFPKKQIPNMCAPDDEPEAS